MDEGASTADGTDVDVVIVGAGFAGLYMLHQQRKAGRSAVVLEAASGVGGTWYWNRYPGARCDIESLEYSYSFDDDLQREWEWSERYATQPEILQYLEHVADRFDLRRDIRFDTRVLAATWDDDATTWTVRTEAGDRISARWVVMATGCLSSAMVPDIEGAATFAGPTYHTGRWPHDGVDFTGLRVGIIGTGSSAIQSIPLIAEQAAELTVFQRTASYTVPAWNAPLDPERVGDVKARYPEFRAANRGMPSAFGSDIGPNDVSAQRVSDEERRAELDRRWERGGLPFLGAFNDILLDKRSNELVREFVVDKLHEIVEDPEVAARLTPDQIIGCKRLCVDTGYWQTFNRDHVRLVDLRETPIERITATGIRTAGEDHEVDAIVFATGFDAMTGALLAIDIRGRDGVALRDVWADGPTNLLGLMVAGFPNLFTITGPGSPSVLTNMVVSIEHHVDWITECIGSIEGAGHRTIEATPEGQEAWVGWVNAVADLTLFPGCSSWYLGANVPGKPRQFMPLVGFPPYAEHTAKVAANGYPGFAVDGEPVDAPPIDPAASLV